MAVRDTGDSVLIYLPIEFGVRDTSDSLLIFVRSGVATPALTGRGSQLLYSTDGVLFNALLWLKSFTPSGLETQLLDNTVINAVGFFKTKLAVLIDGGKISYKGVLVPSDPSMQAAVSAQLSNQLLWWQIILTDGSVISFQGYVTRHMPADVSYDKALTFSGEITISGPVSFNWA